MKKDILLSVEAEEVSFSQGEFKNDDTMVQKLNPKLKKRILEYLKEPDPGTIGMVVLKDPITGKCYSHESIIREKDGFEWSSATIYMFEKYDIRLSKEFLKMFI